MKKYSWLFFDADGTLFDFDDSQNQALKKMITKFNIPYKPLFSEIYTKINTQIWKDFEQGKISVSDIKTMRFKLLFKEINVQADPIEASLLYLKYLSEGHKLIAGAEETILKLKDDYELLLITNGLSAVQRPRFANTGIVNYFKEVIISEEVGFSKPQPEIFDICFAKAGNPDKKDVLMIGDGLGSDIKGGFNYGIDTCWCNLNGAENNGLRPTYVINSISQLRKILK